MVIILINNEQRCLMRFFKQKEGHKEIVVITSNSFEAIRDKNNDNKIEGGCKNKQDNELNNSSTDALSYSRLEDNSKDINNTIV